MGGNSGNHPHRELSGRREFLKALCGIGAGRLLVPAAAALCGAAGNASAAGAGIIVLRRRQWSERPASAADIPAASRYSRLTVHHEGARVITYTDKQDVAAHLRSILAGHISNGFGDIAYHFIIDYAGRVWEGRSLRREGAHVSGENAENIGLMLIGNFEEQTPSAAQLQAMEKMIMHLRCIYGISQSRIYGHRDLAASACPGRNLYSPYVEKIKSGVPLAAPAG